MEKFGQPFEGTSDKIEKSTSNGLEFLGTVDEDISITLPGGQWGMAAFEPGASQALENALEGDFDHSGATFSATLRRLIGKAEASSTHSVVQTTATNGDVHIHIGKSQ